jgi:hypothetical protein
MKKQLFFVLLVISFPTFAQKKVQKGYFSLRGGLAIKDDINKGIANLSLGLSPTDGVGIGAGVGFIDFDAPYLPLTVDISFFGKRGKVSPVVIGSAGYGVYNYSNSYATVRGGFTGSINAGVALPIKRNKFFFTGGYAVYSFTSTTNRATAGGSVKAKDDMKMLTITVGIKI